MFTLTSKPMRISALGLLALLAACGEEPGPAAKAPGAEVVYCALGGSEKFGQDCTVERSAEAGRAVIVVRHPDGKFRRLIASADGQNLLAADGADQSQSALKEDRWEVILGDDRYVVPVKADATQG
jgi:hypothetical protein